MKRSSLKNHERALKWHKKEIEEAVKQQLFADAKPITEALIQRAKEGDIAAIKESYDRMFGKVRQNIGLDGGEDGTPIVFMPTALVHKFALDKPLEVKAEVIEQLPEAIKSPLNIKKDEKKRNDTEANRA